MFIKNLLEKINKNSKRAFTLIEIMVVVAILAIITGIVLFNTLEFKEKSRFVRANQEFKTIEQAMTQFVLDGRAFPKDVSRGVNPGNSNPETDPTNGNAVPADPNGIPGGVAQFIAGGVWPTGPWPNTFYDYDVWGGPQYYPGQHMQYCSSGDQPFVRQITLRFCDINGGNCYFPKTEWAEGWETHPDKSKIALYYCISGPCRSRNDVNPENFPGKCLGNCPKPGDFPDCGYPAL